MTNEEAARERDRVRQEASERANIERNQSSKEREQAVKERNAERRQERVEATNALTSGSASIKLAEIARQGGPVGRKLEREIRQFQQTGRVSSWLAGETLKAEAAQNAAQQSAFRQAVTDVISIPQQPIQIGQTNSHIPPLSLKPIIEPEGGGGGATQQPWDLYVVESNENNTTIGVRAGTLNGILPSNWQIQEIISNGAPIHYAKAVVTVVGNNISEVEIVIDTNEPALQQAQAFGIQSTVEFIFGIINNGATSRVIGEGNIVVAPRTWIIASADPPAQAGESPYIIYYNLLEL